MHSNKCQAKWFLSLLLGLAMATVSALTFSRTIVVRDGSIQAAVDQASPGDTIVVPPGVYTGDASANAVVTVNKDNLTIIGNPSAVIDAKGFTYGILVGENVPIDLGGCPEPAVQNFTIKGLTIKNAEDTGLRLVGVEDFRITHGVYLDNEEYGPFPICSTQGFIAHNVAIGHKDASIYVGDDEDIVVEHNLVTGNAIGIEVENSKNIIVRHNKAFENTTGILVVVLPSLPMPFTDTVRIEHNVIVKNNFPNPVADSDSIVGLLPTGTGILNVGGDRVMIRKNVITGNNTLGLALIGNAFAFRDARIDPFVDENEVHNNVILGNGGNPPEDAFVPGADIIFIPDAIDPVTGMPVEIDSDPKDNCFSKNVFRTDFPPGIVEAFRCPEEALSGVAGTGRLSRCTA